MAKQKDESPGQVPSFAMPASTYVLSSDVATVVERVIARFPVKFGHLVNAKLACMKRTSKRAEDTFTVDGAGRAFVRSDRERGITAGFDAGIWFRTKWWDAMSPERRDAWVFHQLSHLFSRPSGGGLVLVGHDVEAFADEAVHFGAWEEQLALFEQNLDQYTPGGALIQRAAPSGQSPAPPIQ